MGKRRRIRYKSEDEWQANRMAQRELGGSDLKTVMGFGEYGDSKRSLFLQRIGEFDPEFNTNKFVEAGKTLEPWIKDMYHYYDPSKDTAQVFRDFRLRQNRKNYTRNENCVILHEDYPWLRFNIDSRITKNWAGRNGILEIKNTSHFAAEKYEDKLNPGFIIQVHGYFIGLEKDYGNIAVLIDGNTFLCFEVFRDEELVEEILRETKQFMDNVEIAVELKKSVGLKRYFGVNRDRLDSAQLEVVQMIENLEPTMEDYTGTQCEKLRKKIKESPEGISHEWNS